MTAAAPFAREPDPLGLLIHRQDGVISRRQVLDAGLEPHLIERMIRRRMWTRLLPGVYVNHTGQPTWRQRAWAGVLHHWPAALSGASAVRAVQGPGWRGVRDSAPIEVAICASRTVRGEALSGGYRVVRTRGFESQVRWNASPPRVSLERAVIDMAANAASEIDAVAILADACGSKRTTARRLLAEAGERARLRRRRWLEGVLIDVAEGTCSVLEHAHLTRVERAHALPEGVRQAIAQTGKRRMYRDVLYEEFGIIVELDGRLFHDSSGQRDADLERDLDAVVESKETVRLGWAQCTRRPCATAGKLARILQVRGWSGSPRRCGPDCAL